MPVTEEDNKISKFIFDAAMTVHTELGPGLLEKVYEDCLAHVLIKNGLTVEKQKYLPVKFQDITVDSGLRLDLLVNQRVIIEVKAVSELIPVHKSQLFTYLKLTNLSLGMLLNFNVKSMRNGVKRVAL